MQEETAAPKIGFAEGLSRKYQYVMDKSSPHVLYRWIVFAVVLTLYFVRVYFANGWFIVTYGLGIYMLNQLIGFLSPQVSPQELLSADTLADRHLLLSSFHAV
jgi:hypothetical protein